MARLRDSERESVIREVLRRVGIGAVTVTGSGEANTASNVGGQAEVFKEKLGIDLRFRTLKAGSNVTVTENTNDITIASSGTGGTSYVPVAEAGSLIFDASGDVVLTPYTP